MPADILQKIVAQKVREIAAKKLHCPTRIIEQKARNASSVRGFRKALQQKTSQGLAAVIAEIKRASPSRGIIREDFKPADIARSYARAGASCLSVLTDVNFFKGHDTFLTMARDAVDLPVLRKDFIIDAYQVFEARALGADCILLIVSILDDNSLKDMNRLAKSLSMDVLIEVHDEVELERALAVKPELLGINNRNLRTFEVSLETTFELMTQVTDDVLLVTESGIRSRSDVQQMLDRGVYGFLVGEAFMRAPDPGAMLKDLFAAG